MKTVFITGMDNRRINANQLGEEGAARIIRHWEEGLFRPENGILQVPDLITPW